MKDILTNLFVGLPAAEDIEEYYRELFARLEGQERYMEKRLLDLELHGGECILCGKPYKKIDAVSATASKKVLFHYFQPSCKCFLRCPICGRLLHWEMILELGYCQRCGAMRCWAKTIERDYINGSRKPTERETKCNGNLILKQDKYWVCDKCGQSYGHDELVARLTVNELKM